jgi:adenylate kinase
VQFYFGGTSLLIVVGVAMDTVQQIESQLIMRHYDGFMKKTPDQRADGAADDGAQRRDDGPPGAGKGTQASGFARERTGFPRSRPGTCCAAPSPRAPLGRASGRSWTGASSWRRDDHRDRARAAGAPDAAAGFVLDGFPRTVPQARGARRGRGRARPAGRRRDRRAGRGAGAAADVAARVLGVRGECRRPEPGPPVPERCDACGGALVQRPDDREEVIRERLRVYGGTRAPLVQYYGGRPFRRINGAQPPERVRRTWRRRSRRGSGPAGRIGGARRDCLQVAGGTRAAVGGASWSRGAGAEAAGGRPARRLDRGGGRRWPRRSCGRRARTPAFKGYHGYPATVCISVNDR